HAAGSAGSPSGDPRFPPAHGPSPLQRRQPAWPARHRHQEPWLGGRVRLRPGAGARGGGSAQQRSAANCRAHGAIAGGGGMIYSRIVGTGSYLPPRVMTNLEFAARLDTSDAWIRERSGQYQRALVIGAEVFSRILDWNDRGTCVLFGDGAGAVVLAAGSKPGVHASVLRADGSQVDMLSVPGNVCNGRVIGSPFVQMNGQGVFKFAVKVLEDSARETLAAAGMAIEDVDWLIPHQANVRILEATARKLGLPAKKLVVTVDHHGNT